MTLCHSFRIDIEFCNTIIEIYRNIYGIKDWSNDKFMKKKELPVSHVNEMKMKDDCLKFDGFFLSTLQFHKCGDKQKMWYVNLFYM